MASHITKNLTRAERAEIYNWDEIAEEGLEVLFLGVCMGVGLGRHEDDASGVGVIFVTLFEDDLFWHRKSDNGIGSYWLPELRRCLAAAEEWLKENCDHDESGGYSFKSRRRRSVAKRVFLAL